MLVKGIRGVVDSRNAFTHILILLPNISGLIFKMGTIYMYVYIYIYICIYIHIYQDGPQV